MRQPSASHVAVDRNTLACPSSLGRNRIEACENFLAPEGISRKSAIVNTLLAKKHIPTDFMELAFAEVFLRRHPSVFQSVIHGE